ncbi:hypothetical protein CDD82_1262 [Ophiocordyceps australis]|uniref:UspA domain-containing protein n=1 Tax=Ophiocordyceps australis TaxID=1399860 RepID=A0A2C5YSS6_9HYPO|nr:hypothetical protein CDD82_1262 [Ophiocordyceps australis]
MDSQDSLRSPDEQLTPSSTIARPLSSPTPSLSSPASSPVQAKAQHKVTTVHAADSPPQAHGAPQVPADCSSEGTGDDDCTSSRKASTSSISFVKLQDPALPQGSQRPTGGSRIRASSPPHPRFQRHVGFDNVPNGEFTRNNTLSLVLNVRHKGYQARRRSRTFMVGIDENSYSDYAIQWLLDELVDDGDEIVCVHVAEKDQRCQIDSSKYQDDANALMEGIIAKNGASLAVSFILEYAVGKLHATFQKLIQMYQPAMLIVGTRGRSLGGIQGLVNSRNSFSKYCLQYSPVPVVVVRPTAKRIKKKVKRAHDTTRHTYLGMLAATNGRHEADSESSSAYDLEIQGTPDEEAHQVAKVLGLPAKYDPTIKPLPIGLLPRSRPTSPFQTAQAAEAQPAADTSPISAGAESDFDEDDFEPDFDVMDGRQALHEQKKLEHLHEMEADEAAALRKGVEEKMCAGQGTAYTGAPSRQPPEAGGARSAGSRRSKWTSPSHEYDYYALFWRVLDEPTGSETRVPRQGQDVEQEVASKAPTRGLESILEDDSSDGDKDNGVEATASRKAGGNEEQVARQPHAVQESTCTMTTEAGAQADQVAVASSCCSGQRLAKKGSPAVGGYDGSQDDEEAAGDTERTAIRRTRIEYGERGRENRRRVAGDRRGTLRERDYAVEGIEVQDFAGHGSADLAPNLVNPWEGEATGTADACATPVMDMAHESGPSANLAGGPCVEESTVEVVATDSDAMPSDEAKSGQAGGRPSQSRSEHADYESRQASAGQDESRTAGDEALAQTHEQPLQKALKKGKEPQTRHKGWLLGGGAAQDEASLQAAPAGEAAPDNEGAGDSLQGQGPLLQADWPSDDAVEPWADLPCAAAESPGGDEAPVPEYSSNQEPEPWRPGAMARRRPQSPQAAAEQRQRLRQGSSSEEEALPWMQEDASIAEGLAWEAKATWSQRPEPRWTSGPSFRRGHLHTGYRGAGGPPAVIHRQLQPSSVSASPLGRSPERTRDYKAHQPSPLRQEVDAAQAGPSSRRREQRRARPGEEALEAATIEQRLWRSRGVSPARGTPESPYSIVDAEMERHRRSLGGYPGGRGGQAHEYRGVESSSALWKGKGRAGVAEQGQGLAGTRRGLGSLRPLAEGDAVPALYELGGVPVDDEEGSENWSGSERAAWKRWICACFRW